MRNIQLTIAYDGTNYLGWQQAMSGPTIEESLKNALIKFLQHDVTLQAASRTDAGVHASGQIVNFYTKNFLNLSRLRISLNALLPKDIVILEAKDVDLNFHPTLDNVGKTYHYFLCLSPYQLPQHRLYSWHYHHPLDVIEMKLAASFLIGTHDFTSFCNQNKGQVYDNYNREIEDICITSPTEDRLLIAITGKNFLYKMVRNLVGTLVYVGHKKIAALEIPNILAGKNRKLAGVTAPAHGLFLQKVHFMAKRFK